MSEKPSTSAGRLENWDSNQQAYEKQQWESAVYGEAGSTDFSEEAKQRVIEGDAYEQRMAAMLNAGEYDAADTEQLDAIDRTIAGDAQLRRMANYAHEIAELAATQPGEDDDAERMMNSLKDKEDKLEELLLDYQENGAAHEAEKDEIFNRIINMSRQAPEQPAEKDEVVEPTVETAENAEETTDDIPEVSVDKTESTSESEEDGETDEAAPEKASLPAGHVEYDGKQWKVVAINVDEATGEKSFHLVHTASTGRRKKTHLTVGETDLNLPEGSDEADDSIDTSKFAWAGEAKNTEYQGDTSSDSIDLDQFKWANEENEDQPTDEAEDEVITVDTRSRGRRWLNRIKDQYKATVVAGGGNFLTGTFKRLSNYAPERHEGETDEDYERRRQDRKVAMGLGAVAVFGLGAYGIAKGLDVMSGDSNGAINEAANDGLNAGVDLGIDPSVDGSQVVPVGGETVATSDLAQDSMKAGLDLGTDTSSTVSAAEALNPEDAAGAVSVVEVPNIDKYDLPWDWAVEQFGETDAMSKLRELAEKAEADGYTIDWPTENDGNDRNDYLVIDGNSDTKHVIQILAQYTK